LSLQARCAVIAAANPVGGRYDASKTLTENVTLTDPIIQRFDIICVLQDTVDPVADERLASFVVDSHMRSKAVHTSSAGAGDEEAAAAAAAAATPALSDPDIIPQDLLKKYLIYARQNVRPSLAHINAAKVGETPPPPHPSCRVMLCAVRCSVARCELRCERLCPALHCRCPSCTRTSVESRRSATASLLPCATSSPSCVWQRRTPEWFVAAGDCRSAAVPCRRHCRARHCCVVVLQHLRAVALDEDVDMAIRVLLESFIQAQKFAVMRSLRKQFSKYLTYKVHFDSLLLFELQNLAKEAQLAEAVRWCACRGGRAALQCVGCVTLHRVCARRVLAVVQLRLKVPPTRITVPFAELEVRARVMSIPAASVTAFQNSDALKATLFTVDRRAKQFVLDL
jgi:hypothetical protein